jgi:hypothetical protein
VLRAPLSYIKFSQTQVAMQRHCDAGETALNKVLVIFKLKPCLKEIKAVKY